MERFLIDTAKTKQSGADIIRLANELNEQINALYSRLSNMNKTTMEWVGDAANEYIRVANLQKAQYTKIVKILKQYGKNLIDTAELYENNSKIIKDL